MESQLLRGLRGCVMAYRAISFNSHTTDQPLPDGDEEIIGPYHGIYDGHIDPQGNKDSMECVGKMDTEAGQADAMPIDSEVSSDLTSWDMQPDELHQANGLSK